MALKIMGCALVMALPLLPVSAQTSACEAGEELEIVTSSEAMRAALDADLRPVLADKTVALARTERAIAALRPNDTISLETENFPGIGFAGDVDNLEITGKFSRVW
jgi:cobalt-zinc-cadmium efflux system outer membrane protein